MAEQMIHAAFAFAHVHSICNTINWKKTAVASLKSNTSAAWHQQCRGICVQCVPYSCNLSNQLYSYTCTMHTFNMWLLVHWSFFVCELLTPDSPQVSYVSSWANVAMTMHSLPLHCFLSFCTGQKYTALQRLLTCSVCCLQIVRSSHTTALCYTYCPTEMVENA